MKKSFERALSGLLVLAMLIAMPVAAMADGGSTVVNPVSVSPLCDHDYTHAGTTLNLSKASVTAPTCTAAGYTKYTCTKCGQVVYDNFQAPTGHDYSKVTVNSNGTKTFACVKGDASYTLLTETEGNGHSHDGTVDNTKVSSTKSVSPVPGITYVVSEYTCSLEDANGVAGNGCGYKQVVYVATAAENHHSYASHTFGPWRYVTDPTEKKNGVAEHSCTTCGFTEKVLTPMQTAQAKVGRINKDLVNAYSASTGDTVALLLAKGTTFDYANELENGRYRVTNLKDVNSGSTNTSTYYVNPADVEVNPGSVPLTTAYGGLQEIVKILTDGQVNVRAGTSSTSAVKYSVANGTTLEVYRVETVGTERWGRVSRTANEWILLNQSYLSETTAFGFGSQLSALDSADPVAKKIADTGTVVSASTIIVYKDTDTSKGTVGTLPKKTKVTFYYQTDTAGKEVSPFSEKNGVAWGYLDKDEAKRLGLSDAGYVDLKTIHLASDPNPAPSDNPGVIATGIVTSSINLRVRSEPKISVLNQIGSLPTGTNVELLEIGDYNGASWGRINYKGKTGWICMTYVQIQKNNTNSGSNNSTAAAKENGTVVNCSVAVNVRDAAKIQGRLVTTIGVGKRVAITKLENGWGLVDGKGWVYMDYVKLDAGAENEIKNGTNNGSSGSNNPVKTYTGVSALGEVTAETMTVYKEAVAKPGTELLKLVRGNTFVISDRTIINNEIWFKTTVGSVTGWAQGGAFDDGTQKPANVTLPTLSGTVSVTTLNVYANHSADSTVKDVLGVNTAVKVDAQWTDGVYVWGKLTSNQGWVQMHNLKLDVPESNVVTGVSVGNTPITGTTKTETPVYSAANNNTILLKLAKNRTVTVTDWYKNGTTLRGKITDGSIVGWIDLANINQNAVDATVSEDIIYLYTTAGDLTTKSTLSKRQNEKISVIERTLVDGKTAWGQISVKSASGMPNYYWINLAGTSLTASVNNNNGSSNNNGNNNNTNNNNTNNGGSTNNGGTTTAATGTIVNADEVNVRSAAGVANAKVTTLKRGTPVTVYEQKTVDNALWGRIDQGWVAMQYVDLSSKANNGTTSTVPSGSLSGNSILTTVPAGAIGVGFVNTKNLAVRNGAGQGYTQTATLPLYTNVVIYEHVLKGGMIWGRCDQGWICTSYVTYTGTSVTGSGTAGTIARCFYTANVRSAPGVGNALVGKVMVNSRVEILEQKQYSGETWGRTSLGWIAMQYVLADGTIPTP